MSRSHAPALAPRALLALLTVLLAVGLSVGAATPAPLVAQDAQQVIQEMQYQEQLRRQAVNDYTVVKDMAGSRIPEYYEAFQTEAGRAFRFVPITEIERRRALSMGVTPLTPDQMREMGGAYEMFGNVLSDQLASEGVVLPDEADPRRFGAMMNEFFHMGAAYEENEEDDGRETGEEELTALAELGTRATLVGTESIEGRPAYHLRVTDFTGMAFPQEDGFEFTPRQISLWVDTERFVQLRMLVEGNLVQGSGSGPVTIEKVSSDWQSHGDLLVPHQETMRLGGFMGAVDPEQRREMEEAMRQMDEVRAQLAQLPEAQRQMIMDRMGSQMEQMEQMAQGGAIEVTSTVVEVRVNEGPPFDMAEIIFGR
jgi:hypothetical protein